MIINVIPPSDGRYPKKITDPNKPTQYWSTWPLGLGINCHLSKFDHYDKNQ